MEFLSHVLVKIPQRCSKIAPLSTMSSQLSLKQPVFVNGISSSTGDTSFDTAGTVFSYHANFNLGTNDGK